MERKITKRARQALETKQRIQDSAMALFREKDLEYVSIAEICRAANVSSGHFYNFFESKEALLMDSYPEFDDFVKNEFIHKTFESNVAAIKSVVRYQSTVVANLGPCLFSQIMRLQHRFNGKFVIESGRFYNHYMKVLVKQAMEEGELNTYLEADEIGDMILRQVRGVMFDWGLRRGEYDVVIKVQQDLQILLDGLLSRKA